MKTINKKGVFLPSDWLIGFLLFSGVIAFGFLMAIGLGTEYGTTNIDAGFQGKYDKMANTTALISESFTQLNSPGGMGFLGSFNVIFQATTGIISLMFSSLLLIPSMFISMGSDLGIPTIVSGVAFVLILGVITASLIFAVIAFIARGRI